MNLLLLLMLIFISPNIAFATDLLFYSSKKSSKVDLNQDGKVDVETLVTDGQLRRSIFTPSWNPSLREIFTRLNKSTIKQERWNNNKYIKKKIIYSPTSPKEGTVVEIYEKFNNHKWHSKTVITKNIYLNQKVEKYYSLINGQWKLKDSKTESFISLTDQSRYSCISNARNGIKEASEFKMEYEHFFPKDFRYYPTKLGYRIDYNSCPPKAIEQFDQAIQLIADQKLTCLKELNPDLAHDFVRNLAFQENIIYCSTATKVNSDDSGSGAYGYTYFSPDAAINILHLDESSGEFDRSIEGLASTLFHETLHHHLPSCENHNQGHANDGIMGCEFMCSGYTSSKVYTLPLEVLSKASLEGCRQCVSTEKTNSCLDLSYLKEIDECVRNEKAIDNKYYQCASKVAARHHPKKDECLKKTSHSDVCDNLRGIEIHTHPQFDTCMLETKSQDFCTSQYPDFSDKLLSGAELFAREDFLQCFQTHKNADSCRSPLRISEVNNPFFKECVKYNNMDTNKCLDGGLAVYLKKEFKVCMQNMGEKNDNNLDFCRQCTSNKATSSSTFNISTCFQKEGLWTFKSECDQRYGKKCSLDLVKSFLEPEFNSCTQFYNGDFIQCKNLSEFKDKVVACLGFSRSKQNSSSIGELKKIFETAADFYQGRGPALTHQKCLSNPETFKIKN